MIVDVLKLTAPMKHFLYKVHKFKKGVIFIQNARKKIRIARIYKTQFYKRFFERELKFLIEFFNNQPKTREVDPVKIVKKLKMIDEQELMTLMNSYREKLLADYMIYTREEILKSLIVRLIKNNP